MIGVFVRRGSEIHTQENIIGQSRQSSYLYKEHGTQAATHQSQREPTLISDYSAPELLVKKSLLNPSVGGTYSSLQQPRQ